MSNTVGSLAASVLLALGACSLGVASGVTQQAALTARLTSGQVVPGPHGVPARARGRFSASFHRYRTGWESARFTLTTSRLTGPVVEAHVHAGRKGTYGPVLITLCEGERCALFDTGARIYPAGLMSQMKAAGAYVDVHTRRNPRGELRGQIVITQ